MNEIIIKMKRIDDIIQNRIEYSDINSLIEWFVKEPEWEDIFLTELILRGLKNDSQSNLY